MGFLNLNPIDFEPMYDLYLFCFVVVLYFYFIFLFCVGWSRKKQLSHTVSTVSCLFFELSFFFCRKSTIPIQCCLHNTFFVFLFVGHFPNGEEYSSDIKRIQKFFPHFTREW